MSNGDGDANISIGPVRQTGETTGLGEAVRSGDISAEALEDVTEGGEGTTEQERREAREALQETQVTVGVSGPSVREGEEPGTEAAEFGETFTRLQLEQTERDLFQVIGEPDPLEGPRARRAAEARRQRQQRDDRTRVQRELDETAQRIQRFEETGGGISPEERFIIQESRGTIERAEAVDVAEEAVIVLRDFEQDVREAPEGTTFTFGEETGLSAEQTLEELEQQEESLLQFAGEQEFERAIENLFEAQASADVTQRQREVEDIFGTEGVSAVLEQDLVADEIVDFLGETGRDLPFDETVEFAGLEDEILGAQQITRGLGRSAEIALRGSGTVAEFEARRRAPQLTELLTGESEQEFEARALQQARRSQLQAAATTQPLAEGVALFLPEPPARQEPDRPILEDVPVLEREAQIFTDPQFFSEVLSEEFIAEPVTIGATVPAAAAVALSDEDAFTQQLIEGSPIFARAFTGREVRQEIAGEILPGLGIAAVPSLPTPDILSPQIQEEFVEFQNFEDLVTEAQETGRIPQAGEALVTRRVATPFTERFVPETFTQRRISEEVGESFGGENVPAGFVERVTTIEESFGFPSIRLPRRERTPGLQVRRGELGAQQGISLEPPEPEFIESDVVFEEQFIGEAQPDVVSPRIRTISGVSPEQEFEQAFDLAPDTRLTPELEFRQQPAVSPELDFSPQVALEQQAQERQSQLLFNEFIGVQETARTTERSAQARAGRRRREDREDEDLFNVFLSGEQETAAATSLVGEVFGLVDEEPLDVFTGLEARGRPVSRAQRDIDRAFQ